MNIVFACGGTAGHINPALAVADTIKARDPKANILFIGNPNRMEATLVPSSGYRFQPLLVEGFRRRFSPKNIAHNVKSVYYMLTSGKKVRGILSDFKPDVVMGTGGYVSGPVLRTASKMGIKTITHESNSYPGVTTKLLTSYVDKILLVNEDAKKHLPEGKNYIVTGNPVRPEIMQASRTEARRKLGVGNKICILSYGGSNGAEQVNGAVAELIARLLPENKTHHIHGTGRFGVKFFPEKLVSLGIDPRTPNLDIREYISNMAQCLAAADLVICRAGAMTIAELQAVGKPAILIPSPNVAENHQYYNALALAKRNAAVLLEEKNLTGESLYQLVNELVQDPTELANIGINARHMSVPNAAEVICDEVLELIK